VYYRQSQSDELTAAEMETARRAFRGKLVRLRYSPQFIVNNADELLAIAHSEYARAIEKGVRIEDPVGWTIHCAWRRTQNLLQAESIRPRSVSSEQVAELADDGAPDLEESVLEEDRARKIREAVAKLDEDQRQVIALTFFEDMSVREAARHLGCSASSVQHRRETALRTLRRFLPVRGSEELEVDFGMVCWLSIAAGHSGVHLPAGFEAIIDRAGHGASGLWGRAQDLSRRLGIGGGGETAAAVASSGAGRAAGVCAAGLAAVCLAGAGTGIIGPGVGAFGGGGGGGEPPSTTQARPHAAQTKAPPPATRRTTPKSPASRRSTKVEASRQAASSTPATKSSTSAIADAIHTEATKKSPTKQKEAPHREEVAQVEEETSGIARAGAEAPAGEPSPASASDESSSAPTIVHVDKPAASTTSKATTSEEFNFEK
jgi:RNA polymerase sigma factor (sigma-70 family)